MMRLAALLWLMVVVLAGGYLLARVYHGLNFSTDLMALLPQEEQDSALIRANDLVTSALSRRIVILVGHKDRISARAAATEITHQFAASGLLDITTNGFDKDRLRQMGTFYYPYRFGLFVG